MLISLQISPTEEPVSLELAKEHCVIEGNEDDGYLYEQIIAARQFVELRCNRKLVRQKWRTYFDHGFAELPLLPYKVQEVEGIYYLDTDGAEQTLSSSVYTVDIPRQRVYLAYNQTWPATRTIRNAIWMDVWAGEYRTTDSPIDVLEDIPGPLRSAMLLLIGEMYKNREKTSDMAVHANETFDMLIAPYIHYARW